MESSTHTPHFHLHVPHFPDDPLLNGFIQATISLGAMVLSVLAFDINHADKVVILLTDIAGLALKVCGILTAIYASVNFYWSWKDRRNKKQ